MYGDREPGSVIEKVHALLEIDKVDHASKLLSEALTKNPEDSDVEALLAYVLVLQNNSESSESLIKNALQRDPENAQIHYLYSLILREKENVSQAIKTIHTAIQIEPEVAEYHSELARLFFLIDDLKQSEVAANRSLSLDPHNELALMVLGWKDIDSNKLSNAKHYFHQQLKNDPNSDNAIAGVAQTFLLQNNINEALDESKRALQLNPENELAQDIYLSALKAKNPIFWLFWYVTLLSHRIGRKYTKVIIVLFAILFTFFRFMKRTFPEVLENNPYLFSGFIVIAIINFAFCFYAFIANPLFNYFARKGYLK